jgi:DNA-binding NtrC family response regulator
MPRAKPTKPAKPRTAPLRRFGPILIVEDDPVLSLALDQALRDAGAREVVICPSIACTMTELETHDPAAVVIDVHLADRDDGWALAELIGQLGPKRPQIVFSTGAPESIPPEIAEMGVVFEKPYDPALLAETLANGKRRGLAARLRDAIG